MQCGLQRADGLSKTARDCGDSGSGGDTSGDTSGDTKSRTPASST